MSAPDPVLFPIPYIRHIVGQAFRIEPGKLVGVGGRQDVDTTAAKHAAILVTLLATNLSLKKIATGFYMVDEKGVRYAAVRTVERMEADPEMKKRVNRMIVMAKAHLPSRWRSVTRPGRKLPTSLALIGDKWGNDIALRKQKAQRKGETTGLTPMASQN